MAHTPTSDDAPSPRPGPRPRSRPLGPLTPVLDLFSSVWFGIAILAFLFVYMSIGSAAYQVRQMRLFEMTEFEWFHWWPFDLSIALLCITLTVTTIRRIRLNLVNLGVWMIHAGIVILCLGSVVYFKFKIEGDTPVFRRQVIIASPGHGRVDLVALPGARAEVGAGDKRWLYEVVETRPDWPILTGEHKDTRVYSVSVKVTTPTGEFVRQLLDGFPQYTEDVIPGKGRAIKTTGKRLVDDSVSMSLGPMPQEWFYLVNTWALYVRHADAPGAPRWSQRPIRGLPRYNDYVSSVDDVFPPPPSLDDTPVEPHPLSIGLEPAGPDDPLAGATVRVTGYLRYAVQDTRLAPLPGPGAGAAEVNPALYLRLRAPGGEVRGYQLAALDPEHATAENGQVAFRWVSSEGEIDQHVRPSEGRLRIEIPAAKASFEVKVERPAPGAEPAFTDAPGAPGHAYRIREVIDNLPMSDGRTISLVVVDLRTPEKTITRWVAENPAITQDFEESAEGHALRAPDAAVAMIYRAARAAPRIAFVGRPAPGEPGGVALEALIGRADGGADRVPARVGASVEIGEGLSVDVLHATAYSRHETRPAIVPVSQRDKDAQNSFSMIRVEATIGGETQSRWLPFNQYLFDDSSFVYQGRFKRESAFFDLPGGGRAEVIFGRERLPLPAPVQLEDFRLVAHVGGYTGEMASIRDWESVLRFVQPPRASGEPYRFTDAMQVRVNEPVEFAGMRFFQAMWDPPQAARFEGDASTAGLNFTGLGVGNRRGVVTQLAGCCIMVTGMLYAFYAKPILKRRRRERALREAAAGASGERAAGVVRERLGGSRVTVGAGAMEGTVEATA